MHSSVVELLVQRDDSREVLRLKGREAWTLASLIEVGEGGLTPLERPAPRWSAYVHTLRKRGLAIDTVEEHHAGPYPGAHGRYVLRAPLTVLKVVTAEDKRRSGRADAVRSARRNDHSAGYAPDSVS
ncbi:winged helix domain-containing protein [Microvirga aerophila]|uniref:Winged helix domain-containing protein n=1 Tax=Microvirga aerophila TaxID=670291 RepID=A0A512C1D7_9HYPH|nr:hypothetical protein [Microvirga aerophila]GEO17857.1 hypothetical protein MAE02_55530 [Microvirga aerophila]